MGIKQEQISAKLQALPFRDEALRWQAVQARDATADGLFVYAVKTTKIYCRPICKARLARRANVRFYDTGLEAQDAGFRACKRCKPELAGCMPEELAVRKIRAFVDEKRANVASPPGGEGAKTEDAGPRLSLSQMARQTGLSKWHFHRVFKRCVGMTPAEFLRSERGRGTSLSSQSPVSGTLSPWTDSDFDFGLEWPDMNDDMGGYEFDEAFFEGCELDMGLFDMDPALVPVVEPAEVRT